MKRILSVLAIAQSHACADDMRSALSGIAGVRVETKVVSGPEIPAAAGAATNRILVVECRTEQPEDRRMLAQLAGASGQPLIAVVQDATIGDVRELMHLGVVDVVPWPMDIADLTQALELARVRLDALPQSRGRVFSFQGSCGGAGTTTLAIQTAMELVQRDKRRPAKVCLLDLDVQFGNVALALDLGAVTGLSQILDASSRLDPALFLSAMAHHESGLDVLTAPGEIIPFDALTVGTVERMLSFAREEYDHVVVDLPHAWAAWTPSVLAASALSTVVLCPNVSGVQRARRHLKLLAEEGLEALPRLVVANRVEPGWGSGWRQQIREAAKALGHDIAFTVRRDDETADAAREGGKPLRAIKRNSVIEKDVRSIVEHALTLTAPEAPQVQAVRSAASTSGVGALLPLLSLKAAR
ncbi:AAA family ATPase [Azospirillum sp. sgz301742]